MIVLCRSSQTLNLGTKNSKLKKELFINHLSIIENNIMSKELRVESYILLYRTLFIVYGTLKDFIH